MYAGITSSVIIFAFFATSSFSSPISNEMNGGCFRDGVCHYGGRCDDDGMCRCMFDCNSQSWPPTLYCGPKTNGGRKTYLNLCLLLAHACESQSEIPVIKYNTETKKCEDENLAEEKLCETPQDFMGPCGGTLAVDGNLGAGVCLLDKNHRQKRCHCPADKKGTDCHIRVFRSTDGSDDTRFNGTVTTEHAEAKIAMYTSIAILIAVIVVYLILRRFKVDISNRKSCCSDHENHENYSSSCEKMDTKEAESIESLTDSRSSHLLTVNSHKFLKENEIVTPPKRERLSGRSFEFSSDSKSRGKEENKKCLAKNDVNNESEIDNNENNNNNNNSIASEKSDCKSKCNVKNI